MTNQPLTREIQQQLTTFRKELQQELNDILLFWMQQTPDETQGGFYGKIDHHNVVDATAAKGSVLNSRILWTFAAAFNTTQNSGYLAMAHRAYEYLQTFFIDKEAGGVYWTVNYQGQPLDTKKQIYAQAFAVYAFSEYYKATKNEQALATAIELYKLIEKHSYDVQDGGYFEAFARDWTGIDDLRLSEKDANEKKTMNTHLHVLEAYTNLYHSWPNQQLHNQLQQLLQVFFTRMIDPATHHLFLFFDENWNVRSSGLISYGHDIEAAWLLQETAEVLADEPAVEQAKHNAVKMARSVADTGLDKDGGLWYEFDLASAHRITEKHWWPQAEAMVGFFNAWQNSGDERFLRYCLRNWAFVQQHIKDPAGEWRWGVRTGTAGQKELMVMEEEDKVGVWKCPYHNGRACLELIRRVNHVLAHGVLVP